ncbi:Similar to UDP-N-acetylglucosamine transferase subunit ALG14; acc. no. Q6CF02 [Pyronema omphalodes CBS 100304]|uniref:UDP-N-acetylglucosamine transferase subunit ALG14 n=1 Tax=Pyronema omphalodes (strain CBS 100304) TaxID=1076935 RepID=U4L3E1_PYROM|nr:Similar to UDP-N-acetylglucosamine transferase subunit ALG14; acc. no. Q6CF02 [Pyronema omphalodes CBS 100304]
MAMLSTIILTFVCLLIPLFMILLGSGGHTAEMLLLLKSVPAAQLQSFKRTYVVTSGDALSVQKAAGFEQSLATEPKNCIIRIVPRARRVGQSWLSTPWDCVLCLVACMKAFVEGGIPDIVICNGPGSAVLMVLVALGCRFIGVAGTRTIYVESFARTKTLSLSGNILYPLVDRFFVQWPKVKERYPRAEYKGILV